jgi:hypothetical protein
MTTVTPVDPMRDAIYNARRALIDYLCEATPDTERVMKREMKILAKSLDVTYERALRYLMTGSL